MACYRQICTLLLLTVVAADAGVDNAKVPLPYATSGFELETNHLPDVDSDSLASSGSYLRHYEAPEGYKVQTGYEGYIIPAVAAYTSVKPSVLEHLKPYAYKLWSILPTVVVGAVGLLGLLVLGTVLATSVCAFTSLCHISLLGHKFTQESVRGFMTPDKISEVASFLQSSIKKFHDLSVVSKRSAEAEK